MAAAEESPRGVPSNSQRMPESMSADPAELVVLRHMTNERFFAEAERLGIGDEQLRDPDTYDHVFRCSLVRYRAETVAVVAESLGIPITEEQAQAIGRNSLVPTVIGEPAPLSGGERIIAAELYYHAIKAAAERLGQRLSERSARSAARRMVRRGERGPSLFDRCSQAVGCLATLVMAAAAGAAVLGGAMLARAAR